MPTEVAQEKKGSYTVPPEIDGWKGNSEPLRIDYVFMRQKIYKLKYLHVVFDGQIVHKSVTIMV